MGHFFAVLLILFGFFYHSVPLAAHEERLKFVHPRSGAVIPPEIPPITFRWIDNTQASSWKIQIASLTTIVHMKSWRPQNEEWAVIKALAAPCENPFHKSGVTLSISGYDKSEKLLTTATIRFETAQKPVGYPLFYREVVLPFSLAVANPTLLKWRFGDISSAKPPKIVLEKLPVCGNCHSFSKDGRWLGMDIDYASDKGSFVLTRVGKKTYMNKSNVISWSNYLPDKKVKTFGLLPTISPDGRFAVATVKDQSVFVPIDELNYSQLFFPIKGILAIYDRNKRAFFPLPGANNPELVQSNPAFSPDGKTLVFARSRVHPLAEKLGGQLMSDIKECACFTRDKEVYRFDLYKIPFNNGRGGVAEPVIGASHNEKSNFFAKYSPDGRWIVYCQANSYMLLQPDSELWIVAADGTGKARKLDCNNTGFMNSWHTFSPDGRWIVFSSKLNGPYTQLFIAAFDSETGSAKPAIALENMTLKESAANIPEFYNGTAENIDEIVDYYLDDHYYR